MLLCCLNPQFTEVATTQDNSVDWAEIAQAFPPEILQECSTWVKMRLQESTDNSLSPWQRHLPIIHTRTLNAQHMT